MYIIYLEISLKVTLFKKKKKEKKRFFKALGILDTLLKHNTTGVTKHKSSIITETLLFTSCLLLPKFFVILQAQLLYTCKF